MVDTLCRNRLYGLLLGIVRLQARMAYAPQLANPDRFCFELTRIHDVASRANHALALENANCRPRTE
jgi:hypothetical protein